MTKTPPSARFKTERRVRFGNEFRFLILPTTSLIAEYRYESINYEAPCSSRRTRRRIIFSAVSTTASAHGSTFLLAPALRSENTTTVANDWIRTERAT